MSNAPDQTGIYFIKTIVIGDGRKIRGIAMKSLCREGQAIGIKSSGKFSSQMLCIGRAATISGKINTIACFKRFHDRVHYVTGCF